MKSREGPTSARGGRREDLVSTVIDLVAEAGMEGVTVREVAAAAGVSIGTVQHHFRTKDALVQAAFEQVVDATRRRLRQVSTDVGRHAVMIAALGQLLPLDATRRKEGRVYVAFGARAANVAGLQKVQRRLLAEIRGEVAAVLEAAGSEHAVVDAALLLAVVDGLTFQDASAPRTQSAGEVAAVLERAVTLALGSVG